MKHPSRYDLPNDKLREVLTSRYNVDDLKKLADLLPAIKSKPNRKLELIDLIENHVLGGSIRTVIHQLRAELPKVEILLATGFGHNRSAGSESPGQGSSLRFP
jgi:hypothetical protein